MTKEHIIRCLRCNTKNRVEGRFELTGAKCAKCSFGLSLPAKKNTQGENTSASLLLGKKPFFKIMAALAGLYFLILGGASIYFNYFFTPTVDINRAARDAVILSIGASQRDLEDWRRSGTVRQAEYYPFEINSVDHVYLGGRSADIQVEVSYTINVNWSNSESYISRESDGSVYIPTDGLGFNSPASFLEAVNLVHGTNYPRDYIWLGALKLDEDHPRYLDRNSMNNRVFELAQILDQGTKSINLTDYAYLSCRSEWFSWKVFRYIKRSEAYCIYRYQ